MIELTPWIMLVLLGLYHGINPGMGWLFAVALGLQDQDRRSVLRAFVPLAIGHAVSIGMVLAVVALAQAVIPTQAVRWAGAAALIGFGLYKLLVPMSCARWSRMRVGAYQLGLWSFLMATAHGAGLMLVPVVLDLPAPQLVTEARAAERPATQVPPAPGTESGPNPAGCCKAGAPSKAALLAADRGAECCQPAAGEAAGDCCDAGGPSQGFAAGERGGQATPAGTSAAAAEEAAEPPCHNTLRQTVAASAGPKGLAVTLAVLLHTGAMLAAMATAALVVYDRIGLRVLRTGWFNLDLIWAAALILGGVWTLFG